MSIPVIDLFAGPGGLGEGFSSIKDENGNYFFDIKLSIEKDDAAHKTLTFRSFYRQFLKQGHIPEEYYEALRVNDIKKREWAIESLYEKYPTEAEWAKKEAQQIELGHKDFPNSLVDKKIQNALDGEDYWVLIGGPPCQAYSMAGRSRVGGIREDDARVFLYREYLRIIAVHHPAVFVMENVRGMLSAKVEGKRIFDWIKKDLQKPGRLFPGKNSPNYKIYSFVREPKEIGPDGQPVYKSDSDFLIKMENYGIPQKRHRVILLGLREDIEKIPISFLNEQDRVHLKSVIGDMPPLRSKIGRTIATSELVDGKIKRTYHTISDDKSLWFKSLEKFKKEITKWNGLADFKSKSFLELDLDSIGDEFFRTKEITISNEVPLSEWIYDPRIMGLINHQSRSHLLEDLKRYLFLSMYASLYKKFPRLNQYKSFSDSILPDHKSASSGKFNDRFRVQLPNDPATTITSHISKDGHYYIHYDPMQCRSFTVREAARVQTFPDNYLFVGNRTQQFHQVGNAVPPYLARQLAKTVLNLFEHN